MRIKQRFYRFDQVFDNAHHCVSPYVLRSLTKRCAARPRRTNGIALQGL